MGGAIAVVTILGYSAMAGFVGGGGLGTIAIMDTTAIRRI